MNGDYLNDELPAHDLEIIDEICLQFERECRSQSNPEIESRLMRHRGKIRASLLAELLKLEIDYRRRAGEVPSPLEYEARFPEDCVVVQAVFSGETNINRGKQTDRIPLDSDSGPQPPGELELKTRFQVERFHARGGLGEVYVARDHSLDRVVAIKFPRGREPNSSGHRRLQREAEITARLKHPGIVPVHAAGQGSPQLPCYVMQFVEGKTFRDAIRDFHEQTSADDRNRFSNMHFRRLLQHLVAVANTVAYAHSQRVIHRDIKPSNIMLGSFGETLLLDWGIAKVINQPEDPAEMPPSDAEQATKLQSARDGTPLETRPGQPIGTPEFASPEQVMGCIDEHGERSDVYSLGATLYFLLVGVQPIDSRDLTDLDHASALKRIIPPSFRDRKIPTDLSAICQKAMAFEPGERYQTVQGFTDDLERYLADEPVSVAAQSWTTRIRRRIRKNPRVATSIATAIVVALLGVSVGAWALGQKADQLAVALKEKNEANRELVASRETAQQYANEAMSALRTLSGRVVQQWFVKQEAFTEKERQFLQDIVSQYQDLARHESDAWFAKTIEAEAFQSVGQIQILLGQQADALVSIEKAIKLLTPLPEDATEGARVLRATCVFDRGKMFVENGLVDDGIAAMKDGIAHFEQIADEFPEQPNYRELIASAYGKLGAKYVGLRKSLLAIENLRMAQQITAQLVEEAPENMVFLASHANKTGNLGVALAQNGDHESAIVEMELADACYDRLLANGDLFSDVYQASGLTTHCITFAQSLMALNRVDDAISKYEQAVSVARRIVETYPLFPGGYISLARAHHGLASISLERGETDTAVSESALAAEAACQAVELSPESDQAQVVVSVVLLSHATNLEKFGDWDQAEQFHEKRVHYNRQRFERDPSDGNRMSCASSYYRLAKLQASMEKNERAIDNYHEAISLLDAVAPSEKNSPGVQKLLNTANREVERLLVTTGQSNQ